MAALNNHLEALHTACLKDYLNLCVLYYCSGVMGFRKATVIKNQEGLQAHSMDDAVAVLTDRVRSFYAQKEDTKETLTKLVDTAEKITDKLLEEIAERIRSGWRMLDNKAYELQIEGKLLGILLTGRTQYQYVCENSSSSCSVCTELHGKHFDLQEAQAGHNLPSMHPNCRCTIEEYPPLPERPDIFDILDFTLIGKLLGDLEIALQRMALDLDNAAEGIGAIWSYFFGKSFHDFYGTFTTIELGA